jgi:hypothetical protein
VNLGFKFIPSIFNNRISFFSFFSYFFEELISNLNRNLFFIKQNSYKNVDKVKQDLNPFEVIIKKLRNNNFKTKQFPLQYESIEFEYEFYKELMNLKFNNFQNNISITDFYKIKDFIKKKPFKILNCDKNIGSAIISHELFLKISYIHLDDRTNFSTLESDPLDSTTKLISDKLLELKLSKDLSNNLAKVLLVKNPKLGKFNILPKLHKSKFGTRPIINSIDHPTSNISQFLDFILQPFVKTSQSFIKDSQNLIQKLELKEFPDNIKIYSLDFESLYSNINLSHALTIISEFMSNKLSNSQITPIGFYNLLKILFDNNVFTFQNKFYRQIKGIAMGSKCGPSIANIYLSCLEKSFLIIHKPLFYGRYIDDILCILFDSFDINILLNYFDYLKLNLMCDKVVNFLDLNISYDKSSKRIKFSLYIKPTNTFSYLLTYSNHPDFVILNLPKGIFIRVRRINSSIIDFYYFSTKIALQLSSRGYNFDLMCKFITTIGRIDRQKLLEYKIKNDFKKDNILLCKLYDVNLLNLNFNLLNSIDNLSSKFSIFKDFSFHFINKVQPNIGSIFINNIPSPLFNSQRFSYNYCNNNPCNICHFAVISSYYIKLTNNLFIFFKSNSSCSSKEVVYIIKCKKCPYFYIGQTSKTVKDRIYQHLNSIRSFKLFVKHTPVSNHFNLIDHDISDFSFYIFNINLSKNLRLFTESKLIKLFNFCNKKLLNINLSPYINIKHVTI